MARAFSENPGSADRRRNPGRGPRQRDGLPDHRTRRVYEGRQAYTKASAPSPGRDRAALLSLVAAKLEVYETMRNRGWSKVRLAKEAGVAENSLRRLLDLRHRSQMGVIDAALAKMNAELSIDLPEKRPRGRAA